MVKTEAYTFPKPWPDKPECAGSSPVRGIKLVTINPLVVGRGSDGMLTRYKSCQLKSAPILGADFILKYILLYFDIKEIL